MSDRNDLKNIQRWIGNQAPHEAPSIDVLKSELRSDSVIEPPPTPTPPGSDEQYIIIKWKYHIAVHEFDRFHAYLAQHDDEIAADVADLKSGASYLGTYAEIPHGNPHQTFWAYGSVKAVDTFKAALAKKPKSPLYKNLAGLIAFIGDPTMGMHRLVRARALANYVKLARATDPILDLFAGKK